MDPPPDWKIFECIPGVRIKSCGMHAPPISHLLEIVEILLLHLLSNDASKFAINIFPISWGPIEYVNLLYFLLKMQIWNGCNALNIAGNPIKNINVNLTFSVQDQKLWNGSPLQIGIFFWVHFWGQDQKLWNAPPNLTSAGNFWNSTFACTVQWCIQICHKPFSHQLRPNWKCRFEMAAMCLILQETP